VIYSTAPQAITGVTSSRGIDVGRERPQRAPGTPAVTLNVGQMRGRRSGCGHAQHEWPAGEL